MIALLQRVKHANVLVNEATISKIKLGILVLLCIEATDELNQSTKMINKILNYRIFPDENNKMNLSAIDRNASILFVPQFTLSANTQKGLRPSFASVPEHFSPEAAFSQFKQEAKLAYDNVQFGLFGANMDVQLCNWGPVTFMLKV